MLRHGVVADLASYTALISTGEFGSGARRIFAFRELNLIDRHLLGGNRCLRYVAPANGSRFCFLMLDRRLSTRKALGVALAGSTLWGAGEVKETHSQ